MTFKRNISAGALALLVLFCTTEVLAQFPGGGSTRGGRSGAGRESGRGTIQAPRPSDSGDTAELIEYRLGMLEEDLKLSTSQMRSWETYAERVRAIAADIVRERTASRSIAAPNATQQMNRAVDQARNRLTALEDVAAAAKTLYEILSSEQKMLVDARSASIVSLIGGGGQPSTQPDTPVGDRRPARGGSGF